jgi:fatty acid desaturase
VVWIGLPMIWFPAWNVIGFYALRVSLMGLGVFAVSGPGHIPVYAVFIAPEDESRDFLLRQTATTANFTVGWLGRWLCSGLEYQIEHHLFPGICHRYYPELSPKVHEMCRRLGLPYHVYTWDRALWMCFAALARPKRIEPSLEAFRLPPLGTGGTAG